MKMILCTLAVCLMLTASLFTTQALVREEGKRIRAAFAKTAAADQPDAAVTENAVSRKLETLNNQLATLNRRMTALEEALSASVRNGGVPQNLQDGLAGLRQELKGLSAAQARFSVVPGYLADLTRYLDRSFAHVEQIISENRIPETFADAIDNQTQRLDLIENLFLPLYGYLGVIDAAGKEQPIASLPSLDERLLLLSQQTDNIRQDIASLREWMTPRTIEPVKRPR